MDIYQIKDQDSKWFKEMWEVYNYSFPEYEKRNLQSQLNALTNSKCRIDGYVEDGEFVGFITYWIYPNYIFVEHFALSEQMRQGGRGSAILSELIERYIELPVMLDIDPVVDDISERRQAFYFRLGFIESRHQHMCPPYNDGEDLFELLLLTTKRDLTDQEYSSVKDAIYNEIVK